MPYNSTVTSFLPPWFTALYPAIPRSPTPTSLATLDKHKKLCGQLQDHILSADGALTKVILELQSTHQGILQEAMVSFDELNRVTARFINRGIEDIQGITAQDLRKEEEKCVRLMKEVRAEGD